MTDFEYQCLVALVSVYGAEAIIEAIKDIATQLVEDSEED